MDKIHEPLECIGHNIQGFGDKSFCNGNVLKPQEVIVASQAMLKCYILML